ncbi:MAG TPA: hypothetical protein DCE42_25235 [Myxococcales bacterium]|nr:hypothetical protein [Myxococcales bacterium]
MFLHQLQVTEHLLRQRPRRPVSDNTTIGHDSAKTLEIATTLSRRTIAILCASCFAHTAYSVTRQRRSAVIVRGALRKRRTCRTYRQKTKTKSETHKLPREPVT